MSGAEPINASDVPAIRHARLAHHEMLMSNPFSTRFIRPGALAYIFPAGASASGLAQQFIQQGCCGQIIGPHGSGKSTLLAALTQALTELGRPVRLIALHQGQRRLPALAHLALPPRAVLIIDGYEQLSWWSQRRVQADCRRHEFGLLVTAHRDAGLPTLYRVEPSAAVTQAVVRRLLGDTTGNITAARVAAEFDAADGNIRETLFRLYDLYENSPARGASSSL